jgi:hypothetical protein
VLAPAEYPLVVAGLAEGKSFDSDKKKAKGNIGSGHVRIALAAFKALTETEDFNKPEHQDLKTAMEAFWNPPWEPLRVPSGP